MDGITTGIIYGNPSPFEIRFNFRQDQVEFRNYNGKQEVMKLEDLSCLVYSGEAVPAETGGNGMPAAFDERYYECGFWPGDPVFPEPAFYGMPYPLIRDLKGNEKFLRPDKAFFQPEKAEFFLKLKDALNYPSPEKMVADFCRSVFDLIQEISPWKNLPV